jgi:uncharacterized protein YndB with AHSA1/START domain
MPTTATTAPKRKITIERTYEASIEDVWDLWTTKEGFESWWGPDGFAVTVRKLDLRPDGELLYSMTAVGPAQVEFMKKAGMPLTTEARIVFTEVVERRRLAYTHVADFIPGVDPYDISTMVEFHVSEESVRMVLTLDAMHDEQWTQRAVMGWESQLAKLASVLARRGAASGRQS